MLTLLATMLALLFMNLVLTAVFLPSQEQVSRLWVLLLQLKGASVKFSAISVQVCDPDLEYQ